jgi:hypothetical protein
VTWSLRIRSIGRRRAAAYARQHRFEIGAPVEFDERADTVSALEYALGALAGDLVNTFTELARRRRVPLDGVEAVVSGDLENPLAVLEVVGEEVRPHLNTVTLKLYVTSPAPAERIDELWRDAQSLSPLTATLRGALDLQLLLTLTP